jgi:hypothetical protein
MHELDDFMREKIKGTKCLGDRKWRVGNINKGLTQMAYGSVNFFPSRIVMRVTCTFLPLIRCRCTPQIIPTLAATRTAA